jgi:hypothetical protein
MSSAVLTLASVALAISGPSAQIAVGPNVHVSQAHSAAPFLEVVIAADPRDPSRLLAAAILYTRGVVAYRSSDGGKTWSQALVFQKSTADPLADPVIQAIGDPAIAWGADGLHYAVFYRLKANMKLRSEPRPLQLVHSADGGKTWATPVRVMGDWLDRPFLAVDQSGGKFNGRLYCDFSVILAGDTPRLEILTSSDGGRTFSPPRYLMAEHCQHGVLAVPTGWSATDTLMGGQSAVLADGTFIVPYTVFRPPPRNNMSQVLELRLRRSTNGGESFFPEQYVATLGERQDDSEYVSTFPMMAADPGSAHFKNQVYLVWHQYIAKHYRVFLACSKDKGATWSKPIAISEQPEREPYYAVLPAVAVNRKGILAVTWYDSRESRPGMPSSNVRFRASLDGGDTWLPSVRVTDVPSLMALDNPSWKLGKGFSYVGETAGLAADAAGDFHPAWVDKRTGLLQLFTATVSVKETPSPP